MKKSLETDTKARQAGILYGIRGAVEVESNDRESILGSTENLLIKMAVENRIEPGNIVSAVFTATKDLTAVFPAEALRTLGWRHVPALCAHEIDVPTGMKRVIRILLHAYLPGKGGKIRHQYIGRTQSLRPDLKGGMHDCGDETKSCSG